MNDEQIKKEIEKALQLHSETNSVEFKKAMGGFPKKEVRKTLSAFGNADGGIIVFGVEDKLNKTLEVIGVRDVADMQEKMTNLSAKETRKTNLSLSGI